jgi:hypothetical protein
MYVRNVDETLLDENDPLLTRDAIVQDLRRLGIPLSFSRLEKLCMAGEGPPVECHWGKRPLSRRSKSRAWAEQRLKTTRQSVA